MGSCQHSGGNNRVLWVNRIAFYRLEFARLSAVDSGAMAFIVVLARHMVTYSGGFRLCLLFTRQGCFESTTDIVFRLVNNRNIVITCGTKRKSIFSIHLRLG